MFDDKITTQTYRDIAEIAAAGGRVSYPSGSWFFFNGEVVAKERPRKGAGGKMFTPPETRKFEAAVKKWGKEQEKGRHPVTFPLMVHIDIYDKTDDEALLNLSRLGVAFKDKNDIDNLAKSILDGLNGVFYKDDRQIKHLTLTRQYTVHSGFGIYLRRHGLSKNEIAQLRKFMK